jgi:hypothetical protein
LGALQVREITIRSRLLETGLRPLQSFLQKSNVTHGNFVDKMRQTEFKKERAPCEGRPLWYSAGE